MNLQNGTSVKPPLMQVRSVSLAMMAKFDYYPSEEVNRTQREGHEKVIEILDPKAIKVNIVNNWQAYGPGKIVKTMRRLYPNVGTASSQLSNLKSILAALPTPPNAEYLDALKLSKAEYKKLRDDYRDKRDKEGFNLTVVNDSDRLVTQALEMITSSDFRVLWPAAVMCSGLRPVELLTVDIKPSPQTKHPHDAWWVCISSWAKKGQNVKDEKNRDFCRDHPLLCPSYLWTRAIDIIRAHFNKEKLTKRQLHQRFAKYWLQLLAKGFPQLVKPTHVLLRRFYAKYSFLYFQDDFENIIGENSYISWVLGHTSVEPALSYTNLQLRSAGKLKLWDVGRALAVPAVAPRATKKHIQIKRAKDDQYAPNVKLLGHTSHPDSRPHATKKHVQIKREKDDKYAPNVNLLGHVSNPDSRLSQHSNL